MLNVRPSEQIFETCCLVSSHVDVHRFALVDKVRAAGLPEVHLHNVTQSDRHNHVTIGY